MKYTKKRHQDMRRLAKLHLGGATEINCLLDELEHLQELSSWVSITERLPEIIEKDREVNSVYVKYKEEYQPDCGSIYSISNTIYLSKHPEHYDCWMYIPQSKEGTDEDNRVVNRYDYGDPLIGYNGEMED